MGVVQELHVAAGTCKGLQMNGRRRELKAGKQVIPFEIPANSPLMVTVLPLSNSPMDRDYQTIARQGLARAYGDDEPDYSEN